MSYEVLARRLRPVGFDALRGQEHVVRALTHALDHDRLHHAYLFTGTRGVGKTTVARILARCLNCETNGVSSTPCGVCSACTEINEGRFVDLIEVDAASRTGVADTRDLLDNAQYLPTRGRYKVYLIDEVHMLSNAAFNALLKTLEEPPPHIVFLLATTEAKKVPVTVLSRCLQFQLKNMTVETIVEHLNEALKAEGVDHDAEALMTIARAARGSMRDALSITDQAIAFGQGSVHQNDVAQMLGVVGRNEVQALLNALADGAPEALLAVTQEFADRSADFASVLAEMIAELHQLAVDAALGQQNPYGFSAEALHLYYQIALVGHRDLSISPDPKAGVEMTLLRMLTFAPEPGSAVARSDEDHSEGGSSGRPNPEASDSNESPVRAVHTLEKPAAQPQAAVRSAPVEEEQHKQPLPEALAHWYDWVAQAPVQGVARMLLTQSVLEVEDGDNLAVVLNEQHDTLLSDAQVQAMARGLGELLGRAVTVDLRVGVTSYETPAERLIRLEQERQQEAERAIEQDATVQSLLKEFEGRVYHVAPPDNQTGTNK